MKDQDQELYELKEIGISFKEDNKDLIAVFGITVDQKNEYETFDYAIFDKDLNVFIEYDWANFESVAWSSGCRLKRWKQKPLQRQLEDLYFRYGRLDIFGETYQTINLEQALKLLTE